MVLMGLASSIKFCLERKGMPKVFSTCSMSLSLKCLLCNFFPSPPVGLRSSRLTELFLGLGGGTVSGDQAMLLLGVMLMSVSLSTPSSSLLSLEGMILRLARKACSGCGSLSMHLLNCAAPR